MITVYKVYRKINFDLKIRKYIFIFEKEDKKIKN